MLADLLPTAVAAAEAFDDLAPAPLFPAERAQLAGAGAKRRKEFATVRRCARDALARLDHAPVALPRGPGGAPVWPAGTVGSMTHCAGYRAAAVAMTDDVTAIGIDAEPALPLPSGVLGLICSPAERDQLAELSAAEQRVPFDRLLFCAKEAVYKAWFPAAQRWLGFHDATVKLDPSGTFAAELRAGGGFAGRWLVRDGLLLAAIAV